LSPFLQFEQPPLSDTKLAFRVAADRHCDGTELRPSLRSGLRSAPSHPLWRGQIFMIARESALHDWCQNRVAWAPTEKHGPSVIPLVFARFPSMKFGFNAMARPTWSTGPIADAVAGPIMTRLTTTPVAINAVFAAPLAFRQVSAQFGH
jgi:hypothetical protein